MQLGAPSQAGCVLGVERSLSGRRWLMRAADDRLALALAQRHGLPEVAGRILAGRGVGLDDAEDFLNPTLRALMPDPFGFLDMDAAAHRIAQAVQGGEAIAVFGDYDVDGATSTALLHRFLGALGARVRVYVPDRLTEGYGPNTPALLRLKEQGAGLVITVDCGATAVEPLAAAAAAGLDVIVVDHHEGTPEPPAALAHVNPNRFDEATAHSYLAAVGVAFLVCVAVNKVLRDAGWFKGSRAPDLMSWLDIVALGTVCDVVPLVGFNRALVTQGLKVMAKRHGAGLRALSDIARVDEAPGCYHLGFVLGPRVNAGGRVGEAHLGAELLSTDDPARAADIARRLDEFNGARQELEAAVLAEATARIEAETAPHALALAAGAGWHPGVVGIVASRLKDRFNVPACVLAIDGETATGSGRSVTGVDLGAAIIAARQAGLLIKGGGHAMAAGFTVATAQIDALRAFLEQRLAEQIAAKGIVASHHVDAMLTVRGATEALATALARMEPFGAGNPEPRFALRNVQVVKADPAGAAHVRCVLAGEDGGRLPAIAFRCLDTPLGAALLRRDGAPLHALGRLGINRWQGRSSAQFTLDDAAPAL